jgi:hypothetical protein
MMALQFDLFGELFIILKTLFNILSFSREKFIRKLQNLTICKL